jgi:hypothetical protein
MAKIITMRLKSLLFILIPNEKICFLLHRQIHEAIGVAQEDIHTIK